MSLLIIGQDRSFSESSYPSLLGSSALWLQPPSNENTKEVLPDICQSPQDVPSTKPGLLKRWENELKIVRNAVRGRGVASQVAKGEVTADPLSSRTQQMLIYQNQMIMLLLFHLFIFWWIFYNFYFPTFSSPQNLFITKYSGQRKSNQFFFLFCRSLMLLFERFFFFLFYFFFFSFAYHPILPLYLVHRGAGSGGVYPRR